MAECAKVARAEEEGETTIELVHGAEGSKQRTYIFACEDASSCDEWVAELEEALAAIRDGAKKGSGGMTPGAGVRRIRTGPQFRKKCTQTAVDWPRLVPMLTLLLPADIIAASSREDKQQWLSALGGNARGRRRFAQVHSPAQIPLKSPSVLSRCRLPGAGQGQRGEEAGDGGNWRRGP